MDPARACVLPRIRGLLSTLGYPSMHNHQRFTSPAEDQQGWPSWPTALRCCCWRRLPAPVGRIPVPAGLALAPTFASGLGGPLREAEAWSGRPGVLAAEGNWDGRGRLLWAMSVVISLTAERASWL